MITISEYQPSDKPLLVEILRLNTPKYFDPREVYDFERYLNQHADTYLTIKYKDQIAGGTGYTITDDRSVGQITWIFFRPDLAGRGLGRQAVEHCMAIFRSDKRIKKVFVTTSRWAFRFFEKFGLQVTATTQDYWGAGLDLYRMEMTLTSDG